MDLCSALNAACTTDALIFSLSWIEFGGEDSSCSNIFAILFEFKWKYIASIYSLLKVRLLLWSPRDGAGASGDVKLTNNACVLISINIPR